jgi:hypothetical protein
LKNAIPETAIFSGKAIVGTVTILTPEITSIAI